MKTSAAIYQLILISAIVLFNTGISYAQEGKSNNEPGPIDVPDETVELLKAIYERGEFRTNSFSADWYPDGSGYLKIERTGDGGNALIFYDVETGNPSELVSSSRFGSPGAEGPASIEGYQVSDDGKWILIESENRTDDGRTTEYWLMGKESGDMQRVIAGRNSSISPDGKKMLYSDGGNLKVYDIALEKTVSLTGDAVSREQSYSRAIWSPDSKRVAFVHSDASRVRIRSALIPGDPSYPEVSETRFARVGGVIPTLRVGVVDAEGEAITWLPITVPEEGHYIGEIAWAGNSDELFVERHSRGRDKREFYLANVNNGKLATIYEESDPNWVISSFGFNTGVYWFDNYSKFLMLSEKEGWRQAYVLTRDGQMVKKITPGNYDIINRVDRLDKGNGFYYFNASPESAIQSYLYRVRLDGKGKAERITPTDQPGTHSYDISPDAKWAFHTYSSATRPPVTELVTLPGHEVVRVMAENNDLLSKMESLPAQPKEFIQLDIGNGVVMDCWMIKPKDFDPGKKYPVFAYVYGEPHGQTVLDSWGHASADFHSVLAGLGYLVISIDNQGTRCPKGAAWRRAIDGKLGPLSTKQQAAGIRELARMRPYVDLSRVGTWGWSGGGSNTLNAMFREPDLFSLGIAVAPKPQAHLYNAWFQEIYMKTPEINPDGYEQSSPINFAEGLKGNLLIVHGSGETNTHIQITEGLVDRLIELGKQFDYFVYPNRDHGIRKGEGTSLHLRVMMARYLLNHLPAGPR
jgi:dipeptidyl-peptidase-4